MNFSSSSQEQSPKLGFPWGSDAPDYDRHTVGRKVTFSGRGHSLYKGRKANERTEARQRGFTSCPGIRVFLFRLNKLNSQGLNNQVKHETVKHGLNIGGWSIQESKGYFRAFKKVAGKLQGIYLGKDLTDAETKIKAKELQMAGGDIYG